MSTKPKDWIDELAKRMVNDQVNIISGRALNLMNPFQQDDPDYVFKTDPERYYKMRDELIKSSKLYDPKNDPNYKMDGQNDYE